MLLKTSDAPVELEAVPACATDILAKPLASVEDGNDAAGKDDCVPDISNLHQLLLHGVQQLALCQKLNKLYSQQEVTH